MPKNPKYLCLHRELPQAQHHGCQSTDFAGVGTQQELGGSLSPSGVTAHSAAATVRKVWILLPITTKRVEIPCPQHCDSFRVSKKREAQLAVQENTRIESSSPKVDDRGMRFTIISGQGGFEAAEGPTSLCPDTFPGCNPAPSLHPSSSQNLCRSCPSLSPHTHRGCPMPWMKPIRATKAHPPQTPFLRHQSIWMPLEKQLSLQCSWIRGRGKK